MKFRKTQNPPVGRIGISSDIEWRISIYDRPAPYGIVRLVFASEDESILPSVGETITLRLTQIIREDVEQ